MRLEQLDLNDLSSVRQLCAKLRDEKLRLRGLLCNAGVMHPPKRLLTVDGMEQQWQASFTAGSSSFGKGA